MTSIFSAAVLALQILSPTSPDPSAVGDGDPEWWSLEEELRFPVINPERTTSPGVRMALEGPDGSLYLGVATLRVIRRFDANGRFVDEFGEAGNEPGQMGTLDHMAWRGDTLVVEDGHFNRLVFFDPEGNPLGHLRERDVADGRDSVGPWPPRQGLFSRIIRGPTPEDDPVGTAILRGGGNAVSPDTVLVLPYGVRRDPVSIEYEGQEARWTRPYVFHREYSVATNGSSIALLDRPEADSPGEAHYTVTQVDAQADTLLHRAIPYEPEPVDHDRVHEALLRSFASTFDAPEEVLEEKVTEIELPDFAPSTQGIRANEDGTVWVQIWTMPEMPQEWHVLDGEGVPRGRIELPLESEVLRVEGDDLLVTEPTGETLELVRYRAVPSTDG